MCGRFTLRAPREIIIAEFDLHECPLFPPRYNIAPTQNAPIVRLKEEGQPREIVAVRWGLIPFWAKDPSIGNRLINARADTVLTKPAFRAAIKKRRCLVPVDGFYEWQQGAKPKQPFHIHLASGKLFAFAGLWEHWESEGEIIESFTIITTEANAEVRRLHERMPVIIEKKNHDVWLDHSVSDLRPIEELLQPFTGEPLILTPVNPWVNSARHEDPRCLEPAATQGTLF
jgi:putative SOS response-associated peptidase YedK